jgi:AraC-like DNA-binding protein
VFAVCVEKDVAFRVALVDRREAREACEPRTDLAGMSRPTFTRVFKREAGKGVALWRLQVCLLEALSLLATRSNVMNVALYIGYDSASAFCAIFQRTFGVSPSKYVF